MHHYKQINVYSTGNGKIIIVEINSKGEEVGTPLVITSQRLWDNISKENPEILGQLIVSGIKFSAWLAWILLALDGVLIIVYAAIIVKRR